MRVLTISCTQGLSRVRTRRDMIIMMCQFTLKGDEGQDCANIVFPELLL